MLANLKRVVAALATILCVMPALADDNPALETLYEKLADPDNAQWELTQSDILREWSKSGSPAMDLLLMRGRDAMEAGDLPAAIEHLTALTDHAPEFAEGWNARATAYFLNGDYGPSISDIKATLALNPHHFGALSGLGQIFEELGRPDDALGAYRAALAIHPHLDGVRASVERIERETRGTDL
jgi:tetratricopeptide (TPR) repeat protein